ncbi:hypothetical protein MTR62_14615, partial [Novosphingobium sp. 1949]
MRRSTAPEAAVTLVGRPRSAKACARLSCAGSRTGAVGGETGAVAGGAGVGANVDARVGAGVGAAVGVDAAVGFGAAPLSTPEKVGARTAPPKAASVPLEGVAAAPETEGAPTVGVRDRLEPDARGGALAVFSVFAASAALVAPERIGGSSPSG